MDPESYPRELTDNRKCRTKWLVMMLVLVVSIPGLIGCSRTKALFSDQAAIRQQIVGIWQGTSTDGKNELLNKYIFNEDGSFQIYLMAMQKGTTRAGLNLRGSYEIEDGLLDFRTLEIVDAFRTDTWKKYDITASFDSLHCILERRKLTSLVQTIVLRPDGHTTDNLWARWTSVSWTASHAFRNGASCVRTVTTKHDFLFDRRRVVCTVEKAGHPFKCSESSRETEYYVNYRVPFLEIISRKGTLSHYKVVFWPGKMLWTETQHLVMLKKVGPASPPE